MTDVNLARASASSDKRGSVAFEFTGREGAPDRDMSETIEELLKLPGQVARERQRRVALVLDEFQDRD
jgi:hypothetical protein